MTDLLFVLAIWRISKLFMDDSGPFDLIARVRTHLGVYDLDHRNFWQGLLSCIYCTSLWVSIFFVLGLLLGNYAIEFPVMRVFAYSGGAVLIELVLGEYAG